MEIIDQFTNGRFPLKMMILVALLVLFILGLVLLTSGIKMNYKNKAAKFLSLILGIMLILATILFALGVILFGFNS
ncbi:hypothetical protein SAMN04488700_0413 [Carnobacterium iners]|uniref:Uncharacterized protein n=1 Tax=Carnobacterium iners TaxID=1073423 RepID=A0A1X7MSV5_9LACT|nr:hypothetical protein [Carnobacterium iners]SEL13572.1 hypothetical protein SAMN04488114_12914 [Carnobacterium iners]SMH27033.1 hypothetical protein SAMN04488700_0413 [Carnobacterium iners]